MDLATEDEHFVLALPDELFYDGAADASGSACDGDCEGGHCRWCVRENISTIRYFLRRLREVNQ